ncbi:MAG: hypothetical protein V1758_11925, partial [Pseudomonadota bacterium]
GPAAFRHVSRLEDEGGQRVAGSMARAFRGKIRSWKNRVHHRGTEDTEREICFFVYREIPIDEKNLAEGG